MAMGPGALVLDGWIPQPHPAAFASPGPAANSQQAREDLRLALGTASDAGIPLLLSNPGGVGADLHLSWCRSLLMEAAEEAGVHANTALIRAQQPNSRVLTALRRGRLSAAGRVRFPSEAQVRGAVCIVAEMGLEPIVAALEAGAEVVVAGRAHPAAVAAAVPVWKAAPLAEALHMAAAMKLAALDTVEAGESSLWLAAVEGSSFTLAHGVATASSRSAAARAVLSDSAVAAAAFTVPGTRVVTAKCEVEETDEGVRITGSRVAASDYYNVRVTGVTLVNADAAPTGRPRGEGYACTLDHYMTVRDPCEPFPTSTEFI